MDGRSQDPVIKQLVVFLAEKGGMLVIALGVEHREEEQDVNYRHAYQRPEAVMRDLVEGDMLLDPRATSIVRWNPQTEMDIRREVEERVGSGKPVDALPCNSQAGREAAHAIDVEGLDGAAILPARRVARRQAEGPGQVFITGSDIVRANAFERRFAVQTCEIRWLHHLQRLHRLCCRQHVGDGACPAATT